LGVVAIILGAIAISQAGPMGNGKAKAGLILGIVGLALSIGFWMAARAGMSWLGKQAQQNSQQWQKQLDDATKKLEEERKKADEQIQRQNPASQPGAMLILPTRSPTCVASAGTVLAVP
jgi:hypothetical protein